MKQAIAAVLLLAACGSTSGPAPAGPEPEATGPTAPAAEARAVLAPEAPCAGLLELTVWPDGLEIAGVDRRFAFRDGSVDVDVETLRAAIALADDDAPCAHAAEIAAAGDATYGHLVAAMEAAVAVGRHDVGVVGGSTARYPDPPRSPPALDEGPLDARPGAPPDAAHVPVLRISRTAMHLVVDAQETVIDDVAPLGDDAAMQGLHEALLEARAVLPPSGQRVLLLQADRATSAKLVIDATGAARAAGYEDVLFAIGTSR